MKLKDEIEVKMVSALGSLYGEMIMPKKMKEGLIRAYLESKAVESCYLFIDGIEITDNLNHNPYYHL